MFVFLCGLFGDSYLFMSVDEQACAMHVQIAQQSREVPITFANMQQRQFSHFDLSATSSTAPSTPRAAAASPRSPRSTSPYPQLCTP